MRVTTLSERKAAEAARRNRAASPVVDQLRTYATATGGRFVLFGSFVDRRMRYDSDLDILIDFPADRVAGAWDVVERVCAEADIAPDIHDAATSRPGFRGESHRQWPRPAVTDARWIEVDDDIAAAPRHFALAARLYDAGGFGDDREAFRREVDPSA